MECHTTSRSSCRFCNNKNNSNKENEPLNDRIQNLHKRPSSRSRRRRRVSCDGGCSTTSSCCCSSSERSVIRMGHEQKRLSYPEKQVVLNAIAQDYFPPYQQHPQLENPHWVSLEMDGMLLPRNYRILPIRNLTTIIHASGAAATTTTISSPPTPPVTTNSPTTHFALSKLKFNHCTLYGSNANDFLAFAKSFEHHSSIQEIEFRFLSVQQQQQAMTTPNHSSSITVLLSPLFHAFSTMPNLENVVLDMEKVQYYIGDNAEPQQHQQEEESLLPQHGSILQVYPPNPSTADPDNTNENDENNHSMGNQDENNHFARNNNYHPFPRTQNSKLHPKKKLKKNKKNKSSSPSSLHASYTTSLGLLCSSLTITSLTLGRLYFNDEQIQVVMQSLQTNPILKLFKLYNCHMVVTTTSTTNIILPPQETTLSTTATTTVEEGQDGRSKCSSITNLFANMLQWNTSLERFLIDDCFIIESNHNTAIDNIDEEEDMIVLAKSLERNKHTSLKELEIAAWKTTSLRSQHPRSSNTNEDMEHNYCKVTSPRGYLALSQMLQSNYTLQRLVVPMATVGSTTSPNNPNNNNSDNTNSDNDPTTESLISKMNFYLKLNQAGRYSVLCDENIPSSSNRWCKALSDVSHDLNSLYYFISRNPSWIGSACIREQTNTTDDKDEEEHTKQRVISASQRIVKTIVQLASSLDTTTSRRKESNRITASSTNSSKTTISTTTTLTKQMIVEWSSTISTIRDDFEFLVNCVAKNPSILSQSSSLYFDNHTTDDYIIMNSTTANYNPNSNRLDLDFSSNLDTTTTRNSKQILLKIAVKQVLKAVLKATASVSPFLIYCSPNHKNNTALKNNTTNNDDTVAIHQDVMVINQGTESNRTIDDDDDDTKNDYKRKILKLAIIELIKTVLKVLGDGDYNEKSGDYYDDITQFLLDSDSDSDAYDKWAYQNLATSTRGSGSFFLFSFLRNSYSSLRDFYYGNT